MPESEQDPVGLLGTSLSVAPSLAWRTWAAFRPQGTFPALIREERGCRDQGGTVKKQQCSLRTESWLPLEGPWGPRP